MKVGDELKNGLLIITLFVMSLFFIAGCDSEQLDSKSVLEKMDESVEETNATGTDEITGDTSGLDPVTVYIHSDEAYMIVHSISEKILDSKEKDTGTLYDEYVLKIYFGDFVIVYQGNASIYRIEEDGEETLIKTAFNAGKSIGDDVHELITLIKSQNQ